MRYVVLSVSVVAAFGLLGCNNNREVTVLKVDPKAVEVPKQQPVQQTPIAAQPQVPVAPEKKVAPNQSLRGRIYRVERMNELRNIGQFFQQYSLEFQPNQRSFDGFKNYIKQGGAIHEAVSTKHYIVNLKARNTPDSVVAYEDVLDGDGYMAVWGDGHVEKVAAGQLQEKLR